MCIVGSPRLVGLDPRAPPAPRPQRRTPGTCSGTRSERIHSAVLANSGTQPEKYHPQLWLDPIAGESSLKPYARLFHLLAEVSRSTIDLRSSAQPRKANALVLFVLSESFELDRRWYTLRVVETQIGLAASGFAGEV